MLSIGKKKYRNLQEQVGFNTEQIEKIFATLDGINVQDNVVVVPDMSYILDEDELAIVNKEVAFIVYNGHLYIKRSQDASTAYFDVVFKIVSSTVISFESSEIQVTLSNGGLGIVNSTVNTYSATQIDDKLALEADITYVDAGLDQKANLSGANFSGEITAPSIIQTMQGFSGHVSSVSGYTKSNVYLGVVQTGNKITFVVSLDITKAEGAGSTLSLAYFDIPEEVGAKLFPSSVGGANYLDNRKLQCFSALQSAVEVNAYASKSGNIMVTFACIGSPMVVGTTYHIRYECTFLLSDNLAS